MPSKLLPSVSVRTKLPLIIATPSTIANAVSIARSLRPSSPLRATPIIDAVTSWSASRISCEVGRAEVLDDQAVGEEEDAVGDRCRVRVVGDHHGRLAVARDGLAQEREDLGARAGVEVAGRLVGEHHRRLRDERPGDRDALLLPARELGGAVREPVGEADRGRQLLEPVGIGLRPAIESGRTMFSFAVSIGSRLKNWKMKPMCSRRSFVSCVSLSSPIAVSGDVDVAARSACRGRRGCASASTCRSPKGPSRR